MNISRFIATKVAFSSTKSFTKWIIRIAISAVALSVAVMIVAFSMISGFKKDISEKIFGFWGHIHVTDQNVNRSMEAVPIAKNQDFLAALDTLSVVNYQSPLKVMGQVVPGRFQFKQLEIDIKSIYPYAMLPAMISTKDDYDGAIVRGLGEDYDWSIFQDYIREGRAIKYERNEASKEIIVSEGIAKRLRLKLGDNLLINIIKDGQRLIRRTNIVGIYRTGLEEYDKKFIIADLRKVQELLEWNENQVAGYEIVLNDTEHLGIINEILYYEILPTNLYSETIRDKFPNIFEWLDLQDFNGAFILLLMILVALINMITGILILITERSKMIGTLKALGLPNWGIRKIFLHYAAYILMYGLVIGNVIGLGVCLLQKYTGFIKLDEANYYLSVAPVNISIGTILLLNFIAFMVIIVFLTIPTYIISRLQPVKILRFS